MQGSTAGCERARGWSQGVSKPVLWAVLAGVGVYGSGAAGHIFVAESLRVGAAPAYEGSGWVGEAFLNIPDESAIHLLSAENYARDREPDFTFRTDWIDFPAGPVAVDLDSNFATVGDFLNDYIYDVSDPSKLDEPFCHLLLRFSGFLKVSFADDVHLTEDLQQFPGLPVWVEFGTMGYDGYRTFAGETIYRLPIVDPDNGFFRENAIIMAAGLFPIRITYFNRYDPDGELGMERAGIELYSWHGGGLPWPAGEKLVHPIRGPATLLPPRVVYQAEDILPLVKGDFDADADVDVSDFQWFQDCYTGSGDGGDVPFLGLGCHVFDFEDDNDVDRQDFAGFQAALTVTPHE